MATSVQEGMVYYKAYAVMSKLLKVASQVFQLVEVTAAWP